jgi:hypothetical protein
MLDAIRDLNIFNMPVWSVKTLSISMFNTVDWPCDCIKPLIVALKRNGNVYALDVSDDILSTQQSASTTPSTTLLSVNDLFRIDGFIESFGWAVSNWNLGELYGAETMINSIGTVIHDKSNRQSFIQRCRIMTGDSIVFFYKSDGLSDTPECIPSECKECTEYFVLQKYYRVRNANLAENMRDKYKQEFYRLQRLYNDDGEMSWISAMNSNVKSSPKF